MVILLEQKKLKKKERLVNKILFKEFGKRINLYSMIYDYFESNHIFFDKKKYLLLNGNGKKVKLGKFLNKYIKLGNNQNIYDAIIGIFLFNLKETKNKNKVHSIYNNSKIKSCITNEPLMKEIWNFFIKKNKECKLVYTINDKNEFVGRVVVNIKKGKRGNIYTNGDKFVFQMLDKLYGDLSVTEEYDLSIVKGNYLVNQSGVNIDFNDIRKINNLQILALLGNKIIN